ncbi:MAG: acylneuraminate cytidylyltransferase family protein, partial [Chloroflexi bacterium]|nr:acylneuraminate cytidylyltransferase family protein [Chloroflexota bacterium]
MVNRPEVLAIIPARGGSKGIPRKNLRDFAGAPLIAYSIVAALQAELVTRVIVSTDDHEIAEVARAWGAEVPFMRPAQFAQDDTTDLPVFEHALQWLRENQDYHPEIVIQLRPTSPIRPVGLLDEAIKILIAHPEADCVRGVVPSGQNPFKMWQINREGQLEPLLEVAGLSEPYNAPRQALPQTYWQTGHTDAIRSMTISTKHSLTGDLILPLLIDPLYTVDIDTPDDF